MSRSHHPSNDPRRNLRIDRPAERERAAATIAGQLEERGIRLNGTEDGEQLATLQSAVELFESTVAALGGDSMVNAPDSNEPENQAFVLPVRRDDEGPEDYAERIRRAADRLRRRHRG
jgi:hypothetical protein